MDVDQYIASRLDGTFTCYKHIVIDGINYYFEKKENFDLFIKNKSSLWSKFISQKMIDAFNENCFSIYFVDEIEEDGEKVADGCCIYKPCGDERLANTLVIMNHDNPSIILHEFGHFIDFCMSPNSDQYFSEMTELKNIILDEMNSFVKYFLVFYNMFGSLRHEVKINDIRTLALSVYYFDPREYFAENFAMFCMFPDYLKSKCPRTYSFISKALGYTEVSNE